MSSFYVAETARSLTFVPDDNEVRTGFQTRWHSERQPQGVSSPNEEGFAGNMSRLSFPLLLDRNSKRHVSWRRESAINDHPSEYCCGVRAPEARRSCREAIERQELE